MFTKQQKIKIVDVAAKELEGAEAFIFIDFTGIKTADMQSLKKKIKAGRAVFKVIKKTLADIVLRQMKLPAMIKDLPGSVAIIGVKDQNESAIAKEVYAFSRKSDFCKILGGIIGGEFVSSNSIVELAKLPAREVLIARAVGAMVAPLRGLATVLNGNLKGLVLALSRIKK